MAQGPKPSQPAVITLLTDFGHQDAYVGIMKGVVLGINPAARLIDLTHEIGPQDILRAALILRSAVAFFPLQTIHIAVVDPGVGSQRRALLIRTASGFLIGPDNGVLSPAARQSQPHSVYVIENEKFFRHPVSQTFHGRDVFAPVAAHLSMGVPAADFGPATNAIVELDLPAPVTDARGVRGEVIYVDHFGNLITNIDSAVLAVFHGQALSVSIGANAVAGPATAYAAVEAGTPVALIGSSSVLEIAVRNGHAAQALGAGPGTPVRVEVRD
jgi:S-adenosylmethionine hydrolase